MTDYKYRLSRSEYIISSFIISNLELEHRARTAATNKFPLWWWRWRWWFRTTAKVINSLANFASSPSRIPIVYSSLHGVNLRPRARATSNQSSILYTSNTFQLPKKGVEKGVKGNSRNSFLGRKKEESKFSHSCFLYENIKRERGSIEITFRINLRPINYSPSIDFVFSLSLSGWNTSSSGVSVGEDRGKGRGERGGE